MNDPGVIEERDRVSVCYSRATSSRSCRSALPSEVSSWVMSLVSARPSSSIEIEMQMRNHGAKHRHGALISRTCKWPHPGCALRLVEAELCQSR